MTAVPKGKTFKQEIVQALCLEEAGLILPDVVTESQENRSL